MLLEQAHLKLIRTNYEYRERITAILKSGTGRGD